MLKKMEVHRVDKGTVHQCKQQSAGEWVPEYPEHDDLGIWQACPLLPILFICLMEPLAQQLSEVQILGEVRQR